MKWLLVTFLKGYRLLISPLYGQVCRYHPSCSAYALQAVESYGSLRGGWMVICRLARCNPWALGGYDPVPGHEVHYFDEDDDHPTEAEVDTSPAQSTLDATSIQGV